MRGQTQKKCIRPPTFGDESWRPNAFTLCLATLQELLNMLNTIFFALASFEFPKTSKEAEANFLASAKPLKILKN